ncbi:GIY-YIG nuclease family protein [Haloarcula sediminis]|uniref:hypothetical protein n=1 Tax=Haloarcula sediminis TaxID=3111777 RepID=UPI002D77EE8D|nr:hypothetical protein [Haloarcula sp. CK38]
MDTSELDEQFEFVGSAMVERDKDGVVDAKQPQKEYYRSDEKKLHPYGEGPFCQFTVGTSEYEGSEGVLVFAVDNEIKYVGRSSDIDRYVREIGNVSPNSCYEDVGQQTVCHVNTKIFYAAQNGREVSLWVSESDNSNSLKNRIKTRYSPSWNLR